ncbi:competence type IV pilus minor pilin ComGG [Bacillus sp. REN3]|uniref:competence type IV pilus minor pilin ComGG n=1 Tax=Bacillus sp. REN3 TaxID=2802440 RepID=UPI001AED701F|nr:competence type IV pilus minor pilin ComGG [Bacillus sp. REN3]
MYPLTIIFLFFMTLLLMMAAQQYVAEARFLKETETIRLQEYYLFCSLQAAESLVQKTDWQGEGSFRFMRGIVKYQTYPLSADREKIIFYMSLDNGEKREAACEYDKVKGQMVKWTEK